MLARAWCIFIPKDNSIKREKELTEEDCLSIATYVLHSENSGRLRAGKILEKALDPSLRGFWQQKGIALPWSDETAHHTVAADIARKLKAHVEARPLTQQVIAGATNPGWKLGPKAGHYLGGVVPAMATAPSTQHLGVVGEYAVMSELAANGWNVAKLAFDDGVDVFATKAGDVRTVQVKTATLQSLGDGSMQFSGSLASSDRFQSVTHYYVLVFRLRNGQDWSNTYFIERSAPFMDMVFRYGRLNHDTGKWSIKVARNGHRFFIEGTKDITEHLGQFATRFI